MLDWVAKKLVRTLPSNKADIFGEDSLLMNSLPYYMLLLISVLGRTIYLETGNSFLILFVIYALLPLLD